MATLLYKGVLWQDTECFAHFIQICPTSIIRNVILQIIQSTACKYHQPRLSLFANPGGAVEQRFLQASYLFWIIQFYLRFNRQWQTTVAADSTLSFKTPNPNNEWDVTYKSGHWVQSKHNRKGHTMHRDGRLARRPISISQGVAPRSI